MANLKKLDFDFKKKRIPIYAGKLPAFPYIFISISLFSLFSLTSFVDNGINQNLFGKLGFYYSYGLFYLFGRGAYPIIPIFLAYGFIFFQKRTFDLFFSILSLFLIVLPTSILFNIYEIDIVNLKGGGGWIGMKLSWILDFIIGKSGRLIFVLLMFISGLLIILKDIPAHILDKWIERILSKLKIYKEISKENKLKEKLKPNLSNNEKPKPEDFISKFLDIIKKNFDVSFLINKKSSSTPWIEVNKSSMRDELNNTKTVENRMSNTIEYGKFIETEFDLNLEPSINTRKFESVIINSKLNEENFKPVFFNDESNLKTEDEEEFKALDGYEDESGNYKFKNTSERLITKIYSDPKKTTEFPIVSFKPIYEATTLRILSEEESISSIENIEFINSESENIVDSNNELGRILDKSNESNDLEREDIENLDLSNNGEVEDLGNIPKQSLFSTLVPDFIKFGNKAAYYVSHKVFAKHEKKINTLAKLESEVVSKKIVEIIKEFGYDVEVREWERGPSITRYEISPPQRESQREKLSKITSLADELKLYLAVKSIRIVAPIPGKSTIGIEVPNKERDEVYLGDILKEQSIVSTSKELNMVLGKDISGKIVTADLNKLPHLLIAGTTGSGKSVAVNSMIAHLLYTKSPDDVRFIMIDPKMVELALYEDIPHLIMPVITDPRLASKALFWAVQEMETRYNSVSELKCRDLKSYNEKIMHPTLGFARLPNSKYKKLPYIVIFIDELSDLMMVSGKELEDYITRISQKSRAVGIHLVMATQRPSVDVITGLIKANCPARIGFHVAQKTDSKIILDQQGADALLGKGDFLYKSPTSPDLQRIQAPYISEEEIENLVESIKKFGKPQYIPLSLDEEIDSEQFTDEEEDLFEDAWRIVKTEGKASASYLQRRLRIGYNKAARLMEMMEDRGYVSAQIGSKPREILR